MDSWIAYVDFAYDKYLIETLTVLPECELINRPNSLDMPPLKLLCFLQVTQCLQQTFILKACEWLQFSEKNEKWRSRGLVCNLVNSIEKYTMRPKRNFPMLELFSKAVLSLRKKKKISNAFKVILKHVNHSLCID